MATFAASKGKKVLRLVIYMSAMLLMLIAITTANKQENTTWQEAMPHEYVAHATLIQQETTKRTIDHLHIEHLISPAYVTGEAFTNRLAFHRSTVHQHAIDYYIYTLEHILI